MKPNTNYTQPEPELELIKASEITPTEVEWLWYPYIPFGKVTILEGDPGDGGHRDGFHSVVLSFLTPQSIYHGGNSASIIDFSDTLRIFI